VSRNVRSIVFKKVSACTILVYFSIAFRNTYNSSNNSEETISQEWYHLNSSANLSSFHRIFISYCSKFTNIVQNTKLVSIDFKLHKS
jgi:hypothetical protein